MCNLDEMDVVLGISCVNWVQFKYAFELILLLVLFYINQVRSWREEKESLLIKGSG